MVKCDTVQFYQVSTNQDSTKFGVGFGFSLDTILNQDEQAHNGDGRTKVPTISYPDGMIIGRRKQAALWAV